MKILLRAPASPRAARPPRPTSVPIKHRNTSRNLKNSGLKPNFFILNSSNYYFGRWPDPVTTSNLKKNPVTASRAGMTRKLEPRATALYSTQAQARRHGIFTALPQSRWCPYLHHIQLEVRCGRRRYVLPSPSVLDSSHGWEIISQTAETATVEAWRGRAPRTYTRARHARYRCAPATGTET